MMSENNIDNSENLKRTSRFPWVWTVLLVGILLVGAYFRLIGIDWDDDHHLHPDERFMTMVATSVSIPQTWSDYFNTPLSSINPHNRGFGFYVYGTLPLVLVRGVGEALDQAGYSQIYLVGRYLSALSDLLTVFLVYLIALRLFRKERLALLAAAFSACAVLQIQLSHYFTVDTFANFFITIGFYFVIVVLTQVDLQPAGDNLSTRRELGRSLVWGWLGQKWDLTIPCVLFGAALGLAMASKVSAAPLAFLLPAALLIRFLKTPEVERPRLVVIILRDLVFAAATSLLVFRIFQPYAFNGPGFFGLGLNEKWIQNLNDISQQSKGNVDFPPALQWARRPITFAGENLVLWGLGLPLGLLGCAGFLWMAWKMIKGEWRRYAILWGWTAFYFSWQSLNFSRSMRYQLPVYPTLAIIAAWMIFALWEEGKRYSQKNEVKRKTNWRQYLAATLGVVTLLGTFVYAYAFTQIYTRPVTRITASEWIYQNVPSAINLKINSENEVFNQTLPFRSRIVLANEQPIVMAFKPRQSGMVQDVKIGHIIDVAQEASGKTLTAQLAIDRDGTKILGGGFLVDDFTKTDDPRGVEYRIIFDQPTAVKAGQTYFLILKVDATGALYLAGDLVLGINTELGSIRQTLPDLVDAISLEKGFLSNFISYKSGTAGEVYLPHIVDWQANPGNKTLRLSVFLEDGERSAEITSSFLAENNPRGEGYTFKFDPPLVLKAEKTYPLRLEVIEGEGTLGIYGSKHAIESSWDDPLPYPLKGYNNPFDYEMGVYRSDLNFEMYWDDNVDKRQRFQSILDQADYIFISSNRQWGTTTRVPERYPLTSVFYRNLLGCPAERDIVWCYRVAQVGMFQENLGFELVQVFQSEPRLGPLVFNSQFAEEAFSVYDHPKVFIFKKQPDYDPERIRSILGTVDLSKVIHLTPGQAGSYKGNLLLPQEKLAVQQTGGSWSELFNRSALQNRYPALGMVLWYAVITLLGWVVYPLVRWIFGGLSDKGYPIAKLAAILVLAYPVWLAGFVGIPFNRLTITMVAVFLLVINLWLGYRQRKELQEEWRRRKKYFISIEILALLFFTIFLLIRLGNPDLWHPYKGGEKPMDFSYLNAVIKSTIFPPYDPWFAGGYLNYYYYGFVLAGVPIKWLGIVPSIAYNLVLPTWFSFLAMGAFSMGWNLLARTSQSGAQEESKAGSLSSTSFYAGVTSSILLLILGNLGTVRMIWQGFQKLVAPISIDEGSIFQHWAWAFGGIVKFIGGASLPYGHGEWYWNPSRVIPGEPITEFPFFTFLYADPHAHLFALPLTVLGLLWAISFLKQKWDWSGKNKTGQFVTIVATLFAGGLILGALRPTNTWDFPTYLTLAVIAVLYFSSKAAVFPQEWQQRFLSKNLRFIGGAALFALLVGFSFVLYRPFTAWYGQGYNAIDFWKGDHTPLSSYLTHWGLFLFIIVTWFVWETRDWMAKTPASALRKLYPYGNLIRGALIFLAVLLLGFLFLGVKIAILALPLAAWAAVLIFRPGQPDEKRAVLFMVGTALTLTLLVEVTTLRGDIGRMNWVFKFYLQAWTLLSLSAAAGLIWLFPAVAMEWRPNLQKVWQVFLVLLVFGAFLFPLLGGMDKIRDRMTNQAPHTLDGMAYMAYSEYDQEGKQLELIEDYRAIRWMQENVKGSPVIVEANTPEYRWGSRFTIYTGLPGVLGWNWHQRQQRAVVPSEWVTDRVKEIGDFYSLTDKAMVVDFLQKYQVKYIVVGQLERAVYPSYGLAKFKEWDGTFWKQVYQDGQTAIYEVIEERQTTRLRDIGDTGL